MSPFEELGIMDTKKIKKEKKFAWSQFVFIYLFSTVVSFVLTISFLLIMEAANVDIANLNIYLLVLIIILYSLFFGTIIAFIITRSMTIDTEKIQIALERVSSGDFNFKLGKPKNNLHKDIFKNVNHMIDELNSIQMLKNDFVSSFSHEVKTPLSSVKGYAEYLLKSPNLNEEQKSYIKIIISESERLIDTTTNLSLLAKIDNQKLDPNVKIFSIDKQIREIVVAMQPILTDKDIKMEVNLPVCKIKANENFFRHLFVNIINNAVKYSHQSSVIKIYGTTDQNEHRISVQDFGVGMTEITKDRMFEKFYQQNPQEMGAGIGLGMTICKKIIDIYGGKIEVESEINKGTIITVVLPNRLPD